MTSHVVIDGSNLATEGRKLPSLSQLVESVEQFLVDRPHDRVTVLCDASFPNRIDESERARYEELIEQNWLMTPPAGAIGRGDAFILQVASKAEATVLSNDSFQEFHGQHPWLFDEGRLIGGKPVPDVGWVFVDRLPVRGAASRRSVRVAEDTTATDQPETRNRDSTKPAKRTRRAATAEPASGAEESPPVAEKPVAKRVAKRASTAKRAKPAKSEETGSQPATKKKATRKRTAQKQPPTKKPAAVVEPTESAEEQPRTPRTTRKRTARKQSPAKKQAAKKKATASRSAKKQPAEKRRAQKEPAQKQPAQKKVVRKRGASVQKTKAPEVEESPSDQAAVRRKRTGSRRR